MRIQDLPKELMFKEVEKHLNNTYVTRDQIEEFLNNGNLFAIQNKEETMILFVMYRIKGKTFVDFNNTNKALENSEKIEANFENFKNLEYVFEFVK